MELVIKALQESNGGETFFSRIPSFKITDLAQAMLPGCEMPEVGIRVGEKLHEIMVTEEDAPNTYEYDKHFIIFPQMTGSLKVTGNTYTVAVDQREYYHDPFFGSMSYSTPLQLNVTPNDLSVDVRPLPVPKPADFSGGVGKFSISSSLKSSEFKTNQAAAIVYTVTGSGNLKYVQLPDLQSIYPSEIEIYTPSTKQNILVGSTNVSGNVTFDYTFMPLDEGNVTIPEEKLVYFNPETRKYETSVARGYSLHVGKGKSSARSQSRKVTRFNPELLKVSPNRLSVRHTPVIRSYPYWLCFILPVVILAAALIIYRRYVSMHADLSLIHI